MAATSERRDYGSKIAYNQVQQSRTRQKVFMSEKHYTIHRPPDIGAFEFAVLAGLRAAQLMRGCTPKIGGAHTVAVMAQMEVAAGRVIREGTATGVPTE
jgi:hypothetical protein